MTRSAINKAAKTYAGLDVSLKETAICVVDDAGKIVFERSVATDPQVIAKYLAKHALGLERFGLESGSTSAWLWREFRKLGLPVICLDSRHAHRVLSMKRNKNDRNAARGLADLVRMGWYREARVRSIDAQFIRSMLLSRQQLLQSRRAIENQIRGALKTLGVTTGPTKGRRFMPRVTELRADNDWLGPVLDPLIAAHASIAKQLKVVSASVLDAAREDADVRRMMTVPGIGAMTALAFKAAIDDPKRFTSSTKVGPYRPDSISPARAHGLAASARPTIRCFAATCTKPPACS
jgi:transposase